MTVQASDNLNKSYSNLIFGQEVCTVGRETTKYFQTAHVSGFMEVIFFNTRKRNPCTG